ncbi:MAG: diguanylate cyclase [Stappiaceae bacterium]
MTDIEAPSWPNEGRETPSLSIGQMGAFDALSIPVWIFDADEARIVWSNHSGLEFWRAESYEELYSRAQGEDMSPAVRLRLNQLTTDLATGGTVEQVWTLHPDDEPVSLRIAFTGVKLADNRSAIHCIAMGKLNSTPDVLRGVTALGHTSTMISLYDEAGQLVYGNTAVRENLPSQDFNLSNRFVEEADYQQVREALTGAEDVKISARVSTSKGMRWHEISATRTMDAATGNLSLLLTEVDITLRIEAEQQARHLALHDTLTDLPNRIHLADEAKRILQDAVDKENSCACLFLDLDHFKSINDTLGHNIGDLLLVEVANRLKNCLKETDVAARLGGDEFVVLLHDYDGRDAMRDMAEAIRSTLSEAISCSGHELRTSPSIGLAVYPSDGETIDTLMMHADMAMYAAKEHGRNRIRFFTQNMTDRASRRQEMETAVRTALQKGQLEVVFMPRLDVRNDALIGAEAQIRWNDPKKGMLSDGAFLPHLAQTDFIEEIGAMALDKALQFQSEIASGKLDLYVSVRIHERQIKNHSFLSMIQTSLSDSGANPASMELTFSEAAFADGTSEITEKLLALAKMGFRLGVQDFGNGRSNLGYMRAFPLSSLKISGDLIADESKWSITQMVVSMGKLVRADVVADGVSDIRQLDQMQDCGCDFYQGPLFSNAITSAEFQKLLRTDRINSESNQTSKHEL